MNRLDFNYEANIHRPSGGLHSVHGQEIEAEEVETPSFWKSFSACSRQHHNIIAYQ